MYFFFPNIIDSFNFYIVIFLFFIFSFVLSFVLSGLSIFFGRFLINWNIESISTYECGFIPFSDSRLKFEINFYIISILFVIFDLEVVFLFPWAVCFLELGFFGFISMVIFFFILTVGFVFEWLGGALDI